MPALEHHHVWSLDPPHRVTHPEHTDELAESMLLRGWDGPALVGYRTFEVGRIQLLSGTHRLAAAIATQQRTVPVVVWPFTELFHIWGTDRWAEVMASGDSYGQQTSDQQIEDAVFGGELDWGK